MYDNNEIELLTLKLFTGEASTEDILIISDWLRENKENEKIFMQLKEYWNSDISSTSIIDHDRVLDRLSSEIKETRTDYSFVKKIKLKYVGAAAAILIGFLVYWGFTKEERIIHNYSYISGNAVSPIDLPDGTHILLNKNSILSYNDSFGEKNRNVKLEGEAFFEVTQDTKKPFAVDLDGTQITVLGTTFSVKNRPEEATTSTVLVEGSIRFESPDQQVLLNPNQQLVYSKNNSEINVHNVDIETAIAWKENLIRYKSLTFEEVIRMLEIHYSVMIKIENEQLKKEKITGAFDGNLNVEQILNIMKNNIQFYWKKTSDITYVIRK